MFASLVFVTHSIIQFDGPYSRMKLVYGVEHLHKCTLLINALFACSAHMYLNFFQNPSSVLLMRETIFGAR